MTSAELRLGQSCNVTRRFTFALPHSRPRHRKSFDLIFFPPFPLSEKSILFYSHFINFQAFIITRYY